jgi:hypothetical protein
VSDLTGRVLVLLAVGSLLVPAAPSLAADPKAEGHAFQPLQVAATTIMQSALGPLTSIAISDDLNCAVSHIDDLDPEFYDTTACATLVAVGGTLYGPADIPAGSSAGPRTTYTPVAQGPVSGSRHTGGLYDAYDVEIRANAGEQTTARTTRVVIEVIGAPDP